jgi:hypothetical protein
MNKKAAAIIIAIIAMFCSLILYWIFGGKEETPAQPPTETETTDQTSSSEETYEDETSSQLSDEQNKSLQVFVRNFTQKYAAYTQENPQQFIQELKPFMTPDVFAQEMEKNKSPILMVKKIDIKQMYITDIQVGNWYNDVTVPVDVTITWDDDTQSTRTHVYIFSIQQEDTGWKVVGITDASDAHE